MFCFIFNPVMHFLRVLLCIGLICRWLMCRSAGGTFTWWSSTSDIRHYASQDCRQFIICASFSDSAGLVFNPSADQCPTPTADTRTEVCAVQYTRSSGSACPGECWRTENNRQSVWICVISATVNADVAQSVYDDTNAVRPACRATIFTAGHRNGNTSVFYRCWD